MKTKLLFLSVFALIITSCNFSKSVKKDFITGLASKGNMLSCDDVFVSVNGDVVHRNTFTYGEVFIVNFNGISGFESVNGTSSPGMKITVVDMEGDTVLKADDLYNEEVKASTMLLQSILTVGNPIHSNKTYKLYVNIWDKNGKGTFKTMFKFDVIPNENIKTTKTETVKCKEIYFMSEKTRTVITSDRINLNENIFWHFEGLDGFEVKNNNVNLGLSLIAVNSIGDTIMNYPDLYKDAEITFEEFNSLLSPYFVFTKVYENQPYKCTTTIWDKNGEAKLTSIANIYVNSDAVIE